MHVTESEVRGTERAARGTESGAHATGQCCLVALYTVHTTDLRKYTVLCIVWVTVYGHCSQTLFMVTV